MLTTYLKDDEKAWGLVELDLQSPGSKGFHRYQIVQVIRNGQIAQHRTDMGSSKKFKGVRQIRIPSLLEHTVSELKDMANHLRYETEIDLKDFLQLDKMKVA